VQELELEQVASLPKPLCVEDCHTNKLVSFKKAVKPAAAVETGVQQGCVKLRFARRPATHVEMLGMEGQFAARSSIDCLDHLAPVDGPHLFDLVPLQQPA